MVKLSTLKYAALFTTVVTVGGCSYMYVKIQERVVLFGDFYNKSIEALKKDDKLSMALGVPLYPMFIDLSSKDNLMTNTKIKLAIPVRGSKNKGLLHTECSKEVMEKTWRIDSLVLEVNKKSFNVKIPSDN
ncbi:cytochrome c oxidase assembly factor 1 homolog [Hydra vulgaris]|uniref:Cytochrome c oxidase assembly factor 1 homolog n=1 Tax=Hydra vulgaris TaxID=6087 RepID=A0ABM4C3L6_HYDVU